MTDPRAGTGPQGQRLVAGLVVALALVTGLVLGVAVDRGILLHRGGPLGGQRSDFARDGGRRAAPPERMRQRFAQELGLTAAQMAQVDSIMARQMARRRTFDDSIGARLHVMMDSTRAEVDRVLTPDQRQKFTALRARRDSLRGSGRGRRFGERPPPPPGD